MTRVKARVDDELFKKFVARSKPEQKEPGARGFKPRRTGVPGLDEALKEGIPDPGLYISTGTAGSPYPTLARQIMFYKVTSNGNVAYYNIEGSYQGTIEDTEIYDWDLSPYIEKGRWVFRRVYLPGMEAIAEATPKEAPETKVVLRTKTLEPLKEALMADVKEGRWCTLHLSQLLVNYRGPEVSDLMVFWSEAVRKFGGVHFAVAAWGKGDLSPLEEIADGVFTSSQLQQDSKFDISITKMRRIIPEANQVHARLGVGGITAQ